MSFDSDDAWESLKTELSDSIKQLRKHRDFMLGAFGRGSVEHAKAVEAYDSTVGIRRRMAEIEHRLRRGF